MGGGVGAEGEGGADSRSINHSATKSALGGLVSPRDFVSYGTIPPIPTPPCRSDEWPGSGAGVDKRTKTGAFFNISQPCEHAAHPESGAAIRAQAQHYSLAFRPSDPPATTNNNSPPHPT